MPEKHSNQQCGMKTGEHALFCQHCGTKLAHGDRESHMPWIRYIAVALLVLAIVPWPYGYYLLLRVAVFSIFGYYFFLFRRLCKRTNREIPIWVWMVGGFALLFNPFIPAHLFRMLWAVFNLAGAYLIYKSVEWERHL